MRPTSDLCWNTARSTASLADNPGLAPGSCLQNLSGTLSSQIANWVANSRPRTWHIFRMRRKATIAIALLSLLQVPALAGQTERVYKWVDENGQVHYGDSIPAEYSDLPKQVLNEHAVKVQDIQGRKTEEQRAAEAAAAELELQKELQARADQALLATYLTVEEIVMHRDRRIELFQAQARVTELYLRNLERRLTKLKRDAEKYRPYNEDPDAPMIDPGLVADINETQATIARHEQNLLKFQEDEQMMVARFEGDINRFKRLKGVD